VGHSKPWEFRKGSQAFSRKLERLAELLFLKDDTDFFEWASEHCYVPIAVEISSSAKPIENYTFPERPAVVVGNEARGLSKTFLARCRDVVRIPQYGPAECLNVGVSCCIALYELNRGRTGDLQAIGGKYRTQVGNQ
jgi:tRNA G18 (ribose-2'-O)-methylase SpoU